MPRRAKGVTTVGRHGEPRLQLTIRIPASPRQQVRLDCVEGRVPARSLHVGGDRAAATSSTLASFPRGSRSARVPPFASKHTPRAAPLCAHDGAPRRRSNLRAPGCREGRDADARRPAPEHAERPCGAPRHVERPSLDEGTTVVDPHDNRPAIGEVRHPHPGAERQRGMSRREGVGREALAARGPVAL